LRNTVERMIVVDLDGLLDVQDLPDELAPLARERDANQAPRAGADALIGRPLVEVERFYIEKALEATGGKRAEAAALLGIGERTLFRKIKEYGLT